MKTKYNNKTRESYYIDFEGKSSHTIRKFSIHQRRALEDKESTNYISTTIYTLLNFVPLNLFQQFRRLANFYFLLSAIISLGPWSPINPWINFSPLIFVLSVSGIKAAIDDLNRRKEDRKANNKQFKYYDYQSNEIRTIKSGNLMVGDLVFVEKDRVLPADIVVISTSDVQDNLCFIETSNLDGETNIKERVALKETTNYRNVESFQNLEGQLQIIPPNEQIYQFQGRLLLKGTEEYLPLTTNQLLLRGTTLRNSEWVWGVIVYAGKDTKMFQNLETTHHKFSRFEKTMNKVVFYIFLLKVIILIISSLIGAGFTQENKSKAWYLNLEETTYLYNFVYTAGSYFILYSYLIPISLYVTVEMVRIVQSLFMYWDVELIDQKTGKRAHARNSNLNEELGQVEHIFSDKTGTLTENEMIFKTCSINGNQFSLVHSHPKGGDSDQLQSQIIQVNNQNENTNLKKKKAKSTFEQNINKTKTENPDFYYQMFFRSLALCHTVLPGLPGESAEKESINVFQNASRKLKNFGKKLKLDQIKMHIKEDLSKIKQIDFPSNLKKLKRSKTTSSRGSTTGASSVPVSRHATDQKEITERSKIDPNYQKSSKKQTTLDKNQLVIKISSLSSTNTNTNTNTTSKTKAKTNNKINSSPKTNSISITETDTDTDTSTEMEKGSTKKISTSTKDTLSQFSSDSDSSLKLEENSLDVNLLQYHGQSPDEVALVYAAKAAGYVLLERKRATGITLYENGEISSYPIKAVLEFDSDRKRMSIITRDESGRILLICKGADNVLIPRGIQNNDDLNFQKTLDDLNNFANQGLRTLLFGYRYLEESEFSDWLKRYNQAKASLINREDNIHQVCEEIEKDLILFGATGIEDKLQPDVPETIDYLLKAGINIWLLTGDKPGTAVSVGHSCKLIRKIDETILMKERKKDLILEIFNNHYNEICKKYNDFSGSESDSDSGYDHSDDMDENNLDDDHHDIDLENGINLKNFDERVKQSPKANAKNDKVNKVIVMTGKVLGVLLEHEEEKLFELTKKCRSVIFSRVTPKQKSQVVDMVHKYSQKVTLAIGDGANDVSMIRTANIGIGLVSKEGNQAVRVSDFSLARFKHLKRLICVHGRYCYLRLQEVVLYSFYKNVVFILPQFWWSFFGASSGQTLYNDWFMSLFNMLFNAFPPFIIGITEKDVSEKILKKFPQLYKDFQRDRFNMKKVITRIAIAIFQSLFVFFSCYLTISYSTTLYSNGKSVGLRTVGTIVCSISIIISIFDHIIRIRYWTWLNHFGVYFSLISVFAFLWPYSNLLDYFPTIYKVFEHLIQIPHYYLLIIFNIIGCLLPEIVAFYIKSNYYPKTLQILKEKEILSGIGSKHGPFNGNENDNNKTKSTDVLDQGVSPKFNKNSNISDFENFSSPEINSNFSSETDYSSENH